MCVSARKVFENLVKRLFMKMRPYYHQSLKVLEGEGASLFM